LHDVRGGERSFERDHAVQKPRLIGEFDWFCFVNRGNQADTPDGFEPPDRLPQLTFAIPEVRTERKIRNLRHVCWEFICTLVAGIGQSRTKSGSVEKLDNDVGPITLVTIPNLLSPPKIGA